MTTPKWISFLIGFSALFLIYHFPEFFSEFWIAATFKIGFLVAAAIVAVLQGWKGLGGFGLNLKNKWKLHLLAGVIAGISFFSIYFFTSVNLRFQEITSVSNLDAILNNLPLILLMTAIPSLAEDILTRGYLYAHLGDKLSPFTWILLSSGVYVLNHIWRLNDGPAVLLYLFSLGLVLAYAVYLTRSLWLAFGIHWGSNIAYEMINSSIGVKTIGNESLDTYLLAVVWMAVLIGLFLLKEVKRKTVLSDSKLSL